LKALDIVHMKETTLDIERIQDMSFLETIRDDWNALLQKSGTKTIELSWEWQTTYWRHFNENAELFVLIIREAHIIVAIVPLKLTHTKELGMDVRRLEIIAAAESNYQDLIIGKNDTDILTCVFDYLLKCSASWDILLLYHIPEASKTTDFLRNRLADYPLRKTTTIEQCMFLEIDRTLENRRKKTKELALKIRRSERNLGRISLRPSSTPEQFRKDMLVFFDLHRKRWNLTETPSMFNEERYCEFYLEVTRQLNSKNEVELWTLVAGEIQLAQLLSFAFGKSIVIQLQAYDIDYRKYSPTVTLLDLYVDHLISNGTEIMDIGSYNPYKAQWADQVKNRVNFQVYPKRFWPDCMYVLAIVHDALLYYLRKSDILLRAAKYIRRKLRSLYKSRPQPNAG